MRQIMARLKPALASTTKQADIQILHLTRVLQSAQGIDATISTLAFISQLVHSQLTRLLARQYEKIASLLASKTSAQLLPGEAVFATLAPPQTKLAELCTCMKASTDVLIDVWVFTRLLGLLNIYKWARETLTSPPRDPIIKTLVWGQIFCATLFQVGENVAYLASKAMLPASRWPEGRAVKWMAVACRFWMGQTVLEILRLLRVRQLQYNEDFGAQQIQDGKEIKAQSEALKKQWTREWYAQMGWLPLTLHLSFLDPDSSPIGDSWQAICGLVPSVIALQDVWRETTT